MEEFRRRKNLKEYWGQMTDMQRKTATALKNPRLIPITNQQYLEWNNNDEYIINLMATILGYTLTNPTPASATQKVNIQPTITPPSLTSIPEPVPTEPESTPTDPVSTDSTPEPDPVP